MLDDIKKTLWAVAEYKHLVLGLIFLKYVPDTFAAGRRWRTATATKR
jgi:type I restriction enzyme M protein